MNYYKLSEKLWACPIRKELVGKWSESEVKEKIGQRSSTQIFLPFSQLSKLIYDICIIVLDQQINHSIWITLKTVKTIIYIYNALLMKQ